MPVRIRLPKDVAQALKNKVFAEADAFNYCGKDRVANGDFILRLVNDQSVGGVLAQYFSRDRIKTYIKDGILNGYVKDRLRATRPENIDKIVRHHFKVDVSICDEEIDITLLKSSNSAAAPAYFVVAEGTYVKWETALRKALLYPTGKPFTKEPNVRITLFLLLNACGKQITPSDKKHLEASLKPLGIVPHIYAEC